MRIQGLSIAVTTAAVQACRRSVSKLALIALLIISRAVLAQPPLQVKDSRGSTAGATAEEILASLRQSRPANDVIPSDAQRAQPAARTQRPLLPEGFRVLNLIGSISKQGDWWMLKVEGMQSFGDIRLLYNRTLEQMIHTSVGAGSDIAFSVSGELTVFKDQNYLFARVASRNNVRAELKVPAAAEEAAPQIPTDGSSEDVLLRLRSQKPDQEILSGNPSLPALPTAVAHSTAGTAAESVPLTQRPGRVWGQGEHWTFTFESSANHPSDLPLRVLPNHQLERIISAIENSTMPLVFIVSGEITSFEGSSHLLVRAATRRVSSGELGK